ncbi:hypothetical protein [Psychrosphaera haliotis]|uniref:Uncharacterized protein n=1 Tax=Psychrosphaera haliotis TaxID=555083 RepID=A0A6N8F5I8_9GAMM|nr:hypothetical protein [Psychrosphaera haliotis]MUH71458.1 hypothetical protein [Psychrosphaera haliotis]
MIIKVGIFWFYQQKLIARSIKSSALAADSMGLIDSPFQHITEWESHQLYLPDYKELRASEYQEYPRGRVVFSQQSRRAIIYMDKSLFSAENKQKIKAYFEITDCLVLWKADPHYRVFSDTGY